MALIQHYFQIIIFAMLPPYFPLAPLTLQINLFQVFFNL